MDLRLNLTTAMAEKLSMFPEFSSLANEHLGIIVQILAEQVPLQKAPENIPEFSVNNPKIYPEPSVRAAVEDVVFNLDISDGEIAGRAVLLKSKSDEVVEQFWVFGATGSDEDIDRNNFQLLRKLPKVLETHLFIDECYQMFLERSADSDGLANYARMLGSKHLSPLDFIKALLTSPEGRNYVETLVIVPYPSAHLNKRDPPGLNS